MKKTINVNRQKIAQNRKRLASEREPVISIHTYKSNTYYNDIILKGVWRLRYSPDKPLSCGAVVWLENLKNDEAEKLSQQGISLVESQS
jgi:hypothetical protein